MSAARAARASFSPAWLARRLAELAPDGRRARFCVALSGGVDSVALLAALRAGRVRLSNLRALHVDHHLHPSSARWRMHAAQTARSLGVPCKVLDAAVRRGAGLSIEAEARRERYRLFAQELGAGEVLLTAHHLDDQAETLLLQLLRGAGVAGLAAMPERTALGRGWHVRPLLAVSRAQVLAWARERGLEWVDDESNADERFDRNYLRRRIVPLLEARWPGFSGTLARSAGHMAEAQRLLERLARRDLARARDGAALSAPALRALDMDSRRNALRAWLRERELPRPDATRLETLVGPLLAARADATPTVEWPGAIVRRHRDRLIASVKEEAPGDGLRASSRSSSREAPLVWPWRRRRRIALPGGLGQLELLDDRHGEIDLARLPHPLELHRRRGGERLRMHANGPRRALKDLLREASLAPWERPHVPLVYGDDRLLAAVNVALDQSIRASPESRRRARLVWRRDASG